MSLEHIRYFRSYAISNLVEAAQQMIGAIVRERGPSDAYKRGTAFRRGACVENGLYILRSGRDDHMVVSVLAQKVTSGRQMASNPASSFGIEFGDIDDLQAVSPVSRSANVTS